MNGLISRLIRKRHISKMRTLLLLIMMFLITFTVEPVKGGWVGVGKRGACPGSRKLIDSSSCPPPPDP